MSIWMVRPSCSRLTQKGRVATGSSSRNGRTCILPLHSPTYRRRRWTPLSSSPNTRASVDSTILLRSKKRALSKGHTYHLTLSGPLPAFRAFLSAGKIRFASWDERRSDSMTLSVPRRDTLCKLFVSSRAVLFTNEYMMHKAAQQFVA
jgi:hypothetical protein